MRGPGIKFITALLAASVLCSACFRTSTISRDTFFHDFYKFQKKRCPKMPEEERKLLPTGIWEGCGHDYVTAAVYTVTLYLESGFKVRKWFPTAKNNMDCAGAHNALLCRELYNEGLIKSRRRWEKNPEWPAWRKYFQARPDVGTMVAARRFNMIASERGLWTASQTWKCEAETVPALLRLNEVTSLLEEFIGSNDIEVPPVSGRKKTRR